MATTQRCLEKAQARRHVQPAMASLAPRAHQAQRGGATGLSPAWAAAVAMRRRMLLAVGMRMQQGQAPPRCRSGGWSGRAQFASPRPTTRTWLGRWTVSPSCCFWCCTAWPSSSSLCCSTALWRCRVTSVTHPFGCLALRSWLIQDRCPVRPAAATAPLCVCLLFLRAYTTSPPFSDLSYLALFPAACKLRCIPKLCSCAPPFIIHCSLCQLPLPAACASVVTNLLTEPRCTVLTSCQVLLPDAAQRPRSLRCGLKNEDPLLARACSFTCTCLN